MLSVTLILPLASRWALRQQARIVAEGKPLTPAQVGDARRAGVRDVGRVRVLVVQAIPVRLPLLLRWAAPLTNLLAGDTAGMALGHGIYVRREYAGDRALLVHELVHVAQYERLGGVRAFLRVYLAECFSTGYPHGPLEQEAVRRSAEICRRPPGPPET